MSYDSYLRRTEAAQDRQELEQRRLDRGDCPKCGSENWNRRVYRAPGVVAPDLTCSWHECDDCGYKLDPS